MRANLLKKSAVNGSTFPGWMLASIGALLVLTVAAAGLSRYSGIGAVRPPLGEVLASLDLRFEQQADNSVVVRRFQDNAILETLPTDGGGFLRGAWRSMMRERAFKKADPAAPFRLVRREGMRYALIDGATGDRMDLDGFGSSHSLAMGHLLDLGLALQTGQTGEAITARKQGLAP